MTDTQIFARQVDKVLAGKAPGSLILYLGQMPEVYTAIGLPPLMLGMTQQTLRKLISKHGLAVDLIKNLPELLQNPIMVFKSSTEPKAVVAMMDAVNDSGKTLVAAIHPKRPVQRKLINLITSVHGKDYEGWFARQIGQGRLLYADKEKALNWERSTGLLLPKEVHQSGHPQIIPPSRSKVKENSRFSGSPAPQKKSPGHENH